jgi:hypothetical protein
VKGQAVSHLSHGLCSDNFVEKFIVIGVFVMIIAALLVAYERPAKSKKKLTGRGGDFES